MASYLQPYDPNSYQVEGYQLPYQQISNALNARTQYYMSAAQNIRNQYDSAFGMRLTNEQNIANLQNDKQAADQQLSKIVKKDLSMGDYSSQALKVFDPIIRNKNYMYDEVITNRVYDGIGQAQSDLKKSGAKSYNPLSVQVMQNTLDDWRSSNPDDYEKYLNDSLGTTYQPYDRSVTETALKNLRNSVKTYKTDTLTTGANGAPYIVTQEGKELTGLQAIEYVNSYMPDQERVQNQLRARMDYTNAQKMIKESGNNPEVINQVNQQFDNLKDYTLKTRQNYYDSQINYFNLQKSLLPEADSRQKQYDDAIAQYNNEKTKMTNDFNSTFKSGIYADPTMARDAQSQLSSFYDERWIGGVVGGLGLDNPTITYKPDQAGISMLNIAANEKKQAAADYWNRLKIGQKAGLPVVMGKDGILQLGQLGQGGVNGNPFANPINQSIEVNDPTLKDDWATEMQTKLAGEQPAKQDDVKKRVVSQAGYTIPDGSGGFIDALTYMTDPNHTNMTFGEVLNKMNDDTSRTHLQALVANAYLDNPAQTKLNKPDAWDNMPVSVAAQRLRRVLDNTKIFNAVTHKLGVDFNNPSMASNLATEMELSKSQEDNNLRNYGSIYKNAAKVIGWNQDASSNPFSATFDDYVNSVRGDLKAKGYSDQEIDKFASDPDGFLSVGSNPNMRAAFSEYGTAGSIPTPNPILQNLKENWNKYKELVHTGLANNSGGVSNAFAKIFNNWDETKAASKSFNAATDLTNDDFTNTIRTSIGSINGNNADPQTTEALQNLVNSTKLTPNLFTGFRVINAASGPYLQLLVNPDAKVWKDLLGNANERGINESWEDFGQKVSKLKLPITADQAQGVFGKDNTEATVNLASGNAYNVGLSSLPDEKGTLKIYKSGNNIVLNGKPLTLLKSGDLFRVDRQNINATTDAALGNLAILNGISMNGVANDPEGTIRAIRQYDDASYSIQSYLKSKGIQPDEKGFYTFSSLPADTQTYLRTHFPTYFNR